MPAVPDSIAVIRQTVSGICEALGADARTVGDIKLAATEACTNVVLHAYASGHEPARSSSTRTRRRTSCACSCATAAPA